MTLVANIELVFIIHYHLMIELKQNIYLCFVYLVANAALILLNRIVSDQQYGAFLFFIIISHLFMLSV